MTAPNASPENYDLVILGSGEGGKYIAWTLAKQGQKAVVIERKWVGGSCPNIACLPSKNIIHSAKVASYFFRSEEFGISKDNVRIDMAAVRDRKRRMVAGLVEMHYDNYKKSGTELVMGSGCFVGPKTIRVDLPDGGTRTFYGENVVINTGTRATIDPIPGLKEARPLTHIGALELDHVPGHLLILGGGYVGLELAQAMRRFGSNVTIVEHNSRLVHREDADVSEGLRQLCADEGINVVTRANVVAVEGASGERVMLRGARNGEDLMLVGTHLLVASGRTPNTEGIGLELAGIEITNRGYVRVDERLQTTAPGV
jgi:pyruvate/2-oxoglutarate dehydrogenase complex dihydrolipoamide dehydrogenase (E3) component